MNQPIQFITRPGTFDKGIFDGIYLYNEYKLPEVLPSDSILLDIGLHIGSFAYTALSRGAGKVYGFEANPDNYAMARENLKEYIAAGRCEIFNCGVWRSDLDEMPILHFTPAADQYNTGGGSVFGDNGLEVRTISLDSFISSIGNPWIYMMKMDCEGSEWPILYTSKKLDRIDRIHGEYHEFTGPFSNNTVPVSAQVAGHTDYSVLGIVEWLSYSGFTIDVDRSIDTGGNKVNLGHFFAKRK